MVTLPQRVVASLVCLLVGTVAAPAEEVHLRLGPALPKRPAIFSVAPAEAGVAEWLASLHLVTTPPPAAPRLVEARGPSAAELEAIPEALWPSAMVAYGACLAEREAAAGTPFRLAYGLRPAAQTPPSGPGRFLHETAMLPLHSLYAAGVALGALAQSQAEAALLDTFSGSARLVSSSLQADSTAQVLAHLATFAAEAETIHAVDVSSAPQLSVDLCGRSFPPALRAVALVNARRIVFAVLNANDMPIRTLVQLQPEWVKVRRVVYRGGPLEMAGTQIIPRAQLLRLPWMGPLLAQEDGYCCATGEMVPLDAAPFALSLNIIEK